MLDHRDQKAEMNIRHPEAILNGDELHVSMSYSCRYYCRRNFFDANAGTSDFQGPTDCNQLPKIGKLDLSMWFKYKALSRLRTH